MGNSQLLDQEQELFGANTDNESLSQPGSSKDHEKRSEIRGRGYTSDARPKDLKNVRKRGFKGKKRLQKNPDSESSESEEKAYHENFMEESVIKKEIPQPKEPERKKWWNLFNNDALLEEYCDETYLQQQSGNIDMMVSNFDQSMAMIEKFIDDISNIDDEDSLLSNANITGLMKNVQQIDLTNYKKLNHENLTNLQKFFSFISLSNFTNHCMAHDDSKKSKSFNILELINFYYEFFWTMTAYKMKTLSLDPEFVISKSIKKIPHVLFYSLFKNDSENDLNKRSRMNEKEFIASSTLLDFCTTDMKKFILDFQKEKYSLELIFPPHLFDDADQYVFKDRNEEKNALLLANILLFIKYDNPNIVEKYGMKVLRVNKSLNEVFREDTQKILNKVLYFNFECLNDMINIINSMWFNLFKKYSKSYVSFIYHSPSNILFQKNVFKNIEDNANLDSRIYEIDYPMKVKDISKFFVQAINTFSLSAFSLTNMIEIQDSENNEPVVRAPDPFQDRLFNNIVYMLDNMIEHYQCLELIMFFFFEIQMFKAKALLGQNFVFSGNMMIQKSLKIKGFKFSLYHEIKPNLFTLLFANFRFFPSFDITLVSYFQKIKQLNCNVIFDYLSPLYMANGIIYDSTSKKVIFNFKISIDQIRQSILMNSSFAVGGERPPTKSEELYLPISWSKQSKKDKDDIPKHIKNNLDKIYGRSDIFTISNLKISSFTNNDVVRNNVILLHTHNIKKIELTRSEIDFNQSRFNNFRPSVLFGKCFILNGEVDSNIPASEKKRILENINSLSTISQKKILNKEEIENTAVEINLNSFQTFKQKDTQITCIESFNISVIFNSETFRASLENWISLYKIWPFYTSKIVDLLQLPEMLSKKDSSED